MKRWFWVLLVIGVGMGGVSSVDASIVINEILADPAADADGDGVVSPLKDEFVELANTDALAASLENWTLADAIQVRHTFNAGSSIPGYGFLVVFGGLSLNNAGDTVTLKDAANNLIDSYTFGPEGGKDVALTRSPDGTGPFIAHPRLGEAFFSPGKTLDGVSHLPLPVVEEPEPDPAPVPDPEPTPVPEPILLPDPQPVPEPLPDTDEPFIPQDLPAPEGGPVVPEPGTWMMFSLGLAPVLISRRPRMIG